MTEQWKQAMEQLQVLEGSKRTSKGKWVIDEALDQMLNWTESTLEPEELVQRALQNARKRVARYHNRQVELDGAPLELSAPGSMKAERMELVDLAGRVGLTEGEHFVMLRSGQGYCVQEIASERGATCTAVYHLRDRGRAKIRAALGLAA